MGRVVIGTCRLCLRPEQRLLASHILPRWAYKKLRDDETDGNPNPVLLDSGPAIQTSKQLTEHLLCENCEQKLSPAEKHVAQLAFTREAISPLVDWVQGKSRQADVSIDTIAYFAVSVFWRASASSSLRAMRLGSYAEHLRAFVARESPFPRQATIHLFVLDARTPDASNYSLTAATPSTARQDACHRHSFYICGLAFEMFVGQQLPAWTKDTCLIHSKKKPILLVPESRLGVLRALDRLLLTSNSR